MSMVPTPSQSNQTYMADGQQQPVEAHIVVSDPENPGQYIQQEIHYVQTDENGEAILEQNGTTQVVHIVQQENGELAYQDSEGQVYTAENTQVMFQSTDQPDFIPNEIHEAIAISDADSRLDIPDAEQLSGSEGQLGVTEGDDQQEVHITVPEFIDQGQPADGELVEGSNNEQLQETEAITPEDLTTAVREESHNNKEMTNTPQQIEDSDELKNIDVEETEHAEGGEQMLQAKGLTSIIE